MKNNFLFFCLLLVSSSLFAQEKILNELATFKVKNSGTMLDTNNDVDGYYFFYEADKLKKGKREFAIKLLDANLNDVASKSYIDDKRTSLMEGKFNNQELLFLMNDTKDKQYKMVRFNRAGDRMDDIVVPYTKIELDYTQLYARAGALDALTPIEDKGYLFNYLKKNKKLGFGLKYIPTDGGKSWDYNSPKDVKEIQNIKIIAVNKKYIVLSKLTKKSMLSKTFNSTVVILNTNTGKKILEKKYDNEETPRSITNAFLDEEENLILVGEYFNNGENIFKSKSQGLYSEIIDVNGNEISFNKVNWEKEIAPLMPVAKDGKKAKREHVFFHDIIKSNNGNYYFIGEKFKQGASAGGIASAIINKGGSVLQLTITDAILFEFDSSFNLKDIKAFEKGKSRFSSPAGYGNAQTNAYIVNALGGFDYEFTQIDKDRNRFYANFIDYERLKGESNKLAFKSIIYNDGVITEDKIYLKNSKGKISYRVMPAKLGHVLLLEYNSKEKTLNLHLEKLNL